MTLISPPVPTLPSPIRVSGASALVAALRSAGVEYIFGVPGDTSLALYDALRESRNSITHVLARDERAASIMADVYARLSGKAGVCEAPSGAGAFYLVPGVAEANVSSVPMLALTTDTPLAMTGRNVLTEMDQAGLFAPVTKWRATLHHAHRAAEFVEKALRIATGGRCGATQLTLPEDILAEIFESQESSGGTGNFAGIRPLRAGSDPELVAQAVTLLGQAKRPLIVAGGGVLISRAWSELTELAEMLSIPVATSINGKGSIDEKHPLSLGIVGGNGARAYTNRLAAHSDLIVFVGCKTDSVTTLKWTLPHPASNAKAIQIDVDPAEIGNGCPVDVGLAADAKLALAAILDRVRSDTAESRTLRTPWADFATLRKNWFEEQTRKIDRNAPFVSPQIVVQVLADLLPRESVLVADAGTPTPLISAFYPSPAGRHVIIPRGYGGLGYAIPGVVAAKIARPDVPVVGLFGDGSFGMAAGSLETIARLKLPVVLIHFNNSSFGWIKALQHFYRDRHYFGVDFSPDTDYAGIARSFGIDAVRVTTPGQVEATLTRAIQSDTTMFIDVVCCSEEVETPPVHDWQRRLNNRVRAT